MTLFERFPIGFCFDAQTGEIVPFVLVSEGRDGEQYWRKGGDYRRVLRAEPWELLTEDLLTREGR